MSIVKLPLSTNLETYKFLPKTIYLLEAGTYNVTNPIVISSNNIQLLGNKKASIVRKSVGGTSSLFNVNGLNVTIGGINFDSDKPISTSGPGKVSINCVVANAANCTVQNCTANNVDGLVVANNNASHIKVLNCTGLGGLRGDLIYCCNNDGVFIDNCYSLFGSANEHLIRITASQDTKGISNGGPSNVIIQNCNLINNNGKETIAVRMAKGPVLIKKNKLYSWFRSGQVSNNSSAILPITVSNLRLEENHFFNRASCVIDQGVDAFIINNTFDGYEAYVPVAITAPFVDVKMINNTRVLMPDQKINDPFYRVSGTLGKDDSVEETGTIEK